MTDTDIVVVGAGLSGLIAARDVERAGARVAVIEGAERVGGKTLTDTVGSDHIDLGAHWIGPKHRRVYSLARELGVRTQGQPLRGRQLMMVGDRLVNVRAGIPAIGVRPLVDVAAGTVKLWRQYRHADFNTPLSQQWSDRSGTDLGRWAFRTTVARDMFRLSVELLLGAHPDDISAEHLLKYLKSGGGLLFLSTFNRGAQHEFFVGGAQQLSVKLADSLAGEIVLGHQVDAVQQDSAGVVVRAGDRAWRARKAIFAVSPPKLTDIDFTPALPTAIGQYAREATLGVYSKFVAVFDRPWWRSAGRSGNAHLTHGPLRMIVDAGAQSGRGILVGFSVADEATDLIARPDPERRAVVLQGMASVFGAAALTPLGFTEFHWSKDCFAQGAPSAYLSPKASSESMVPPRPDQHLFWAGTDVAVEFNGYLEGAIESGRRAAAEALAALPARAPGRLGRASGIFG